MSRLTITDENAEALVELDLAATGLGKYLKSAATLRALFPAKKVLASPLTERQGSRTLALAHDAEIPVGKNAVLSINGGASVGFGIHPSGSTLFDDGDLQGTRIVPNGTTFTSLGFEVVLGVSGSVTSGSIGFGFSGGTSMRYGYYHPFDVVGNSPTVKSAIVTLLGATVVPADVDDLTRLPVGSIATVAGEGELSFSGEATLSATSNLLATPGLPLIGTVALTQAGSASVNAEWRLNGGFELRVEKVTKSVVRLSYFRRHGRSLSVSAKVISGVSLPIRGKDLLTTLMTAISPNPEADVVALVDAGLDDKAIEAIQDAITASLDRSLTVAAQLEISARSESDALFVYDIELARIDAATTQAVADALHGRLSAIEQLAAGPGRAIRPIVSAASLLKVRKNTWRINLLGILNVRGFVELVQKGHVMFDRVTGSLTAADEISAKRIRITSLPLESDAEKLRQVLFESLMITTAYQASRALGSSLSLTAEHAFLEQRTPTRTADLEDHYRALIGLALCNQQERDQRLAEAVDIGTSTFFIQNRFDPAACDALFLDADGKPRTAEAYETIARQAFLALLPSDNAQAFRRAALASDETWPQLRRLGDELRRALPSQVRNDNRKLALVTGDVLTIAWWASAMSRAASELSEMRAFIGSRDADALGADPEFEKRRRKLADRLGNVVATTAARFDMPWDVLAMDDAARRLGRLEAAIVSSRFAVRYTEADTTEAPPAPRLARERAATRGLPAPRSREARQWTREELDTFNRHVINIREGKLIQSGGFTSTETQVESIFRDHIPAYAEAQRRAGRPARVLFFAHGGLIGESDGLLGVLKRRSFWQLNGIYPVYFVWETGLLETLRDIVGLPPARARERGTVSDGAIELAARRPGKAVWSKMKSSAAKAAGPAGGALLAAELAAKLADSLNGDLEFHALGHSAGAIFHAHFLPVLVQPRPGGAALSVRTLHFLAPAITTDLFKSTIKPLVGAGQPITSLAVYTMTDDLEQLDHTVRPYGKSLLYLVSGAFEDAVPTRILGLQKSLKQEAPLIRFFGIAGTEKMADIVFSRSDAAASMNARSESVTHGGFDNDVSTMTSVARRILDASNSTSVVDYFEDDVRALVTGPEAPAPPDPAPAPRHAPRGKRPAGRTLKKKAARTRRRKP